MIKIEKLEDYSRHDIFDTLASWDNDPQIKAFITPGMNEGDIAGVTGDELMYCAIENKTKHIYLAYIDDKLIATYSIDTDFEHRVHKEARTAWIGIIIGEKDYWGKGIGLQLMQDLEGKSRDLGCTSIELGVFEYNTRAIKLYQSLGYKTIETIENFVFYKGEWRSDIRMLKEII